MSLASALSLVATVALAHPPIVQPPSARSRAWCRGWRSAATVLSNVGTDGGDIRRVAPDCTHVVVASTGDRLAGISVAKDGTILACALNANRVRSIDAATGAASVYANVSSPNFLVQTRRGHAIVSSTFTGEIVDVTNGAHVVLASGFSFPDGLAIRKKYLYVADTALSAGERLPFASPGSLGPVEPYASGLTFADGIAFDRPGNLFVVGFDTLFIVDVLTPLVTAVPADPLFDWPSNIAFGRTTPYGKW